MDFHFCLHAKIALKVLCLTVGCFCALSFCTVIYPQDEYSSHPSSFTARVNGQSKVPKWNPQPPSVKCSPDDTFCEDVQNYPTQQVEMAVNSNSSALLFLSNNQVITDSITNRKRPTEVDYKERRVCDIITRTIFPKAAKTSKDVWKFIVNTDTTYKQGIEIEQCSEENVPCNLCTAEKSRCIQKFIGRKLLAFDENSLDSYIDLFNFPAACVCYVNDIF